MKKTTKNERVLKYSAMAGAFLATGAVNSQIQYTDVNPDAVINSGNSPYLLDLDNNTNVDIGFQVVFLSGTYYGGLINYSGNYAAASAASGGMVTSSASSSAGIAAMNTGVLVDSGASFSGSGALGYSINITGIYSANYAGGNFLGTSDKYLGISFMNGANTHYGWIRLDVASDASTITIKDYAYNTVAGEGINTGQTLGLDNVSMEEKVSFKSMLDKAMINVTPDLLGSTISIVDMSGREVSATKIEDVNTTVSYEGMDAGIYNLVVKAEAGNVSKKVYVR